MLNHWFWLLVTLTCILWYSTITFYIAIKGAADIKHMLRALEKLNAPQTPAASPAARTPTCIRPVIDTKDANNNDDLM